MRVRACVFVRVVCVRACVWVCVRMCACVYVRREGRKNTFGQNYQVFVAAWCAWNVFHVYIINVISLSLSVALTLLVSLFVCDSGDSRSLMLYFALALSVCECVSSCVCVCMRVCLRA